MACLQTCMPFMWESSPKKQNVTLYLFMCSFHKFPWNQKPNELECIDLPPEYVLPLSQREVQLDIFCHKYMYSINILTFSSKQGPFFAKNIHIRPLQWTDYEEKNILIHPSHPSNQTLTKIKDRSQSKRYDMKKRNKYFTARSEVSCHIWTLFFLVHLKFTYHLRRWQRKVDKLHNLTAYEVSFVRVIDH